MNNEEELKPYIPAEKITPELTVTAVILGIFLAVVFGAANAYLGLRVGMTISASIPAAVISMGLLRVVMKRKSILESNMVQTIGSAGESLAAGAIFTMPALFLWADEGIGNQPSILEITVISIAGGVLGVLFMIPLRNALIVKEHSILPYPEGRACANVLLAGEKGNADTKTVFSGMGVSIVLKLVIDGIRAIPSNVRLAFNSFRGEIGLEIYPALVSVGYIIGARSAAYMFAGSLVGWLVIIPLISVFGGNTMLYPAEVTVNELYSIGGASEIWSAYVKYIGAGAIATGGFISLVKSLPMIFSAFRDNLKGLMTGSKGDSLRTSRELSPKLVIMLVLAVALVIWLSPMVPVNLLGTILIIVFGFFFAAVSSRVVGLIGSSNNPVSGMCIATLIISSLLLKATGVIGVAGMTGAISIGSIICIIAAMSGDTSQDLKTGYILGATPKRQQIGELIGAVVSAFAIGGVLYLLNNAWGYGSEAVPAPQATLMKLLVEGIMGGMLPWDLVFIGVFLAIAVELVGVPVMPFALGLYLPIHLNGGIMLGGVVRWLMDRRKNISDKAKEEQTTRGTLYCAGMIAGEGLAGIVLAVLAIGGVGLDISDKIYFGELGSLLAVIFLALSLVYFSVRRGRNEKA